MDASHVTRLLLQAAANATKAANGTEGAAKAAATAAAASSHLGWQGGVVIAVLLVGIAVMVLDLVGPDLVFAAMSSIFVAARIIDIKQFSAGFSNTGVLTVFFLYCVAAGIEQTGGLERAIVGIMGTRSPLFITLVKMTIPCAVLSSVLNNTPIVAMLIPIIVAWSHRAGIDARKLLVPMAYAVTFGGTLTLIGTSTNLVVTGLMEKRYGKDGQLGQALKKFATPEAQKAFLASDEGLRLRERAYYGFFEITPYGIPYAVAGLLYLWLAAPGLLPGQGKVSSASDARGAGGRGSKSGADSGFHLRGGNSKGGRQQQLTAASLAKRGRPIFVMRVAPSSGVANKSVRVAGLKGLDGAFLVAVGRLGHLTHAVDPDFLLLPGDALFFAGDVRVAPALAAEKGLTLVPVTADAAAAGAKTSAVLPQAASQTPLEASKAFGGSGSDAASQAPLALLEEGVGAPLLPSNSKLIQAVVRYKGPLVGLSVRQAQLNRRFGAEVVAITRHGSEQSPGAFLQDLVLRGGDVLILAVDSSFDASASAAKDFRKEVSDVEAVPTDREREYVTGLRVTKRGGLAGKTLATAGLLGVNGVRLLAIDRAVGGGTLRFGADGQTSATEGAAAASAAAAGASADNHQNSSSSAASVVLDAGDVCWFTGGLESISYLIRLPGFDQSQTDQIEKLGVDILERRLVQAAVAADSPIVGRSVREAGFRARYDAVVVGISRAGVAMPPDVRDVRLKPGDVLLLDAGRGFARAHANDRAFTLINDVPKSSPIKTGKMWLAIFLLFLMVLSQIVGGVLTSRKIIDQELISLFPAAILTAGLMLLFRCMTADQARKAIMLDVYVCIAFAFAVSSAMEVSNVAQVFANGFAAVSRKIGGTTAPVVAIYMVAGLLTEIVTNNAAAALVYPVAARLGDALGVEPVVMASAVMLGASDAFVSPFGYQCNLMVYAAGNYTTAQFIKFGIPLQLLQFATVTVIFFLRPWKWALCGASVLLLVAVGASIAVLQGDTLAGTRRRLRGLVGRARGRGLFAEEKAADGAAAAPKVA